MELSPDLDYYDNLHNDPEADFGKYVNNKIALIKGILEQKDLKNLQNHIFQNFI